VTDRLEITLLPHHRRMAEVTLGQALAVAADTWGDRTALRFIEEEGQPSYSWRELSDTVARVRSGLAAVGVRRGTKVATLLRNQEEFPLTWLAIAEIGAIIVPLNPKYTLREVEFGLNDSGAEWLVAGGEILDVLGIAGSVGRIHADHVIVAGESRPGRPDFEDLRRAPITAPLPGPELDDVLNIQFTSGTTGLPKGCQLTHRYWTTLGAQAAAMFGDPRRLLADHPFYYMQNQAYLAMAMASGATLFVTRGLSRRKFLPWLVDHEIDFAWVDEGMLDFPLSEADRAHSLRRVPVSAVPAAAQAALEDRFGFVAREWYASTEVGSGLFVPFERDDVVASGTMGLAVPGRETKVIDRGLREVPPGVPGELCIRGLGMMLGYHERDDANADSRLDGGWFRTGDLVMKDADGWHYYVGRLKDMISRSGENIACAEVEQQISGLAGVDEVGVVGVPDAQRGQEVKAIVVPRVGSTVTPSDVVSWARQGLAAFKIPRYVEFRDALPHTASGKIAKAVLAREDPFGDAVIDVTGPDKSAPLRSGLVESQGTDR
jgi:acyl-CoA synthetase (AMP-forming)/AMP-acid ligase II